MGNIDGIKLLAGALSVSLITFVAAAVVLTMYPQVKVAVGDLLRAFGWLGKAVRRASLESELEGTLNSFVKSYNSDLNAQYLPRCEVYRGTPIGQRVDGNQAAGLTANA